MRLVHADGVAACTPSTSTGAAGCPARGGADLHRQIETRCVRETIAELRAPGGPAFVDPRQGIAQVTEAAPYTFAGDDFMSLLAGHHYFSRDIFTAYNTARVDRVPRGAPADHGLARGRRPVHVVSSNVSTLDRPSRRPEHVRRSAEFRYPVWNSIAKGSLNEITPFTFPTLQLGQPRCEGAHTEGDEPSSGTVATSQTVTPSANSGKAKISVRRGRRR